MGKAEKLKEQVATAKAKYDEAVETQQGADIVSMFKQFYDSGVQRAEEAQSELEEAKRSSKSSSPAVFSLGFGNITRMLARNGTFIESPQKRDTAYAMARARQALVAGVVNE